MIPVIFILCNRFSEVAMGSDLNRIPASETVVTNILKTPTGQIKFLKAGRNIFNCHCTRQTISRPKIRTAIVFFLVRSTYTNRIITGDEFFHAAFQDITLHTLLQSITVSLCFRTDPSMTLIHKCLPPQISQTSTSLCFIDLPEKPLPCKNIFADTFTIHKSTVIFTLRYNTP